MEVGGVPDDGDSGGRTRDAEGIGFLLILPCADGSIGRAHRGGRVGDHPQTEVIAYASGIGLCVESR